jgi:hypothetical protein
LDVSFEKVGILSTPKVGYYTVRLGEDPETEFEKFGGRNYTQHQEELKIIIEILRHMGLRGAKPYKFRDENGAHALPNKDDVPTHVIEANKDFGIRLYCLRLTDFIVILFNGDVKTCLDPKQCPNVRNHFRNAISLAKAITKARLDGDLVWTSTTPLFSPLDTPIDL